MGILNLNNSTTTDITNNLQNYSVESQSLDSASISGETSYQVNWDKWHGYYRTIPELMSVIDAKARYTVGKGYKCKDKKDEEKLKKIKGFGKDTFNTILYNSCRTYTIGGDSFAEIIRDTAGRLINIKPLNPSTVTIVTNSSGIIIRYEQITGSGKNKNKQTFSPKDIFHLCWNRLGDEIHGISTIEKIERIILMRNEALEDFKTVAHRNVAPINIWEIDSEDLTEINNFKSKVDNAYKNRENLLITKGSAELKDRLSLPSNQTLDVIPWIKMLNDFFITAEGVPSVVLGSGKENTEASTKIEYLSFQQMVEHNQLFIEENVLSQLGIEIELEFPADLMQNQSSSSGWGNQTQNQNTPTVTSPNSFSKDGNKKAVQKTDITA